MSSNEIGSLCAWFSAVLLSLVAPAHAATEWFALSIDNQQVGFATASSAPTPSGTQYSQYLRVDVRQFKRSGQIERSTIIERVAGQPTSIRVSSKAGIQENGWSAALDVRAGTMRRRLRKQEHEEQLPFASGARLPDDRFKLLTSLWQKPKEASRLRFSYLEPTQAAVINVDAAVVELATIAGVEVLHVRLTEVAGDRSQREDVWLDRQGRLRRLEQPFFGTILRWTACAAKCDGGIQPFDPLARLIVRSPFHVPQSAMQGPLRYVLKASDDVVPTLPATREQAVVRDGAGAVLTICRTCGTEPTTTSVHASRYLKPNAWVQSDHPEIRAFARRTAGSGRTSARMQRLVLALQAHMNGPVDVLGYSTSVEALHQRGGDCTEFAVLLAALARADGIPARIAAGLVYADRFSGKKDVFSPHAWVQVWDDGKWVSYDAALDGFDATHIALAIGDGRPEQFAAMFNDLPRLRIEKLGLLKSTN